MKFIIGSGDLYNAYPFPEKGLSKEIPTLAVVLPFYNPPQNWLIHFVERAQELCIELAEKVDIKYIIVNDGSRDCAPHTQIRDACNALNVTYITYKNNAGKGHALREGVKKADCAYTVITDIDFPYSNKDFMSVVSSLLEGADVVAGKRSNAYFNNLPVGRKIISKCFILLNRIFFKLPVYDTQAGIKGFNEKGKTVFLQTTINRFLSDTEFILRAYRQSLVFKVICLHLRPGVKFSNFGYSTLVAEIKNFIKLLKLNSTQG
ncbi:MAG: glycosyltransferase family 2 protein [Agriterribacter sp.]